MDAIDPAARHWLDAAVSGFDELAVSMLEANGVEKGEDTEALSNDQCGAVIALVPEQGDSIELGLFSNREGVTRLSRALLGMEEGDELSEDEVADCVGELINIVAGNAKGANGNSTYRLGMPVYVAGPLRPGSRAKFSGCGVRMDDIEVTLCVLSPSFASTKPRQDR
ncbi:MAG: chemotaxis protein CheX [Myxococcales bacterium]|nr:chemotaxis protein CheX [Myxococcales bacterium]